MHHDDIPTAYHEAKRELGQRLAAAEAAEGHAAARAASRGWRLPAAGNVLGVGIGAKATAGHVTTDLSLRVYVRTKVARRELGRAGTVPDEVEGVATDVVAVGDLRALGRPVPCGVSIGHANTGAGTLGCVVRRRDGRTEILSNNHVLADVDRARIGDPIYEPGPLDGGTEAIATLTEAEPIRLGGDPNRIDAATAVLLDPADVLPEIAVIGPVAGGPIDPALYLSVRKHGRSTRHTVGVVLDLDADIWVQMTPQSAAWFTGQIGIQGVGGDFSAPGDSGSLVVDAVDRAPVGLLFAGGGAQTFANPIAAVLDRFDASIVGGEPAT